MIQYYGYTISPNQLETGEGFLICRNVPIARTGNQEYLGREIGLDSDALVTVRRPPEEVFSEAALASFEGKPVTDDHPPELLDPDNVSLYLKGHAERVRRGAGEWEGYVIADLHIQDRSLIDAVQRGKREISCGYECEYSDNGDGTYSQKNIRGNHIAVVNRGRAGKRAAILDSDTKMKQAGGPERKAMSKKGLFFKLFGQAVKDKSPEEIEKLAMDAAAAMDEEEGRSSGEEGSTEKGEKSSAVQTTDDETAVDALVDKVLEKLEKKKAEKAKKSAEDSIDAVIDALTGDEAKTEEKIEESEKKEKGKEGAMVVSAEDAETDGAYERDSALYILKTMRPVVAAIENPDQRKAVADALIGLVTAKDSKDDITTILKATQANAHRAGSREKGMDLEAQQAAYDSMNPHKRKETK